MEGAEKIAGGLASLSGGVYNPVPRFERHLSYSGHIDRESDLVNRAMFKAERNIRLQIVDILGMSIHPKMVPD